MANDVELLSMCFFLLYIFFDEIFLLVFCSCSNWVFLSLLGFENSFHILNVSPSSGMWFANISSLSVAYLFILLTQFFAEQKFLIYQFFLQLIVLLRSSLRTLYLTLDLSVLSYALPKSFVVLCFTFNTIICCDFVFVR